MFTRIPGNYFNIEGNDTINSENCSRTFWGMLEKTPGNVTKERFRGLFKKIQRTLEFHQVAKHMRRNSDFICKM